MVQEFNSYIEKYPNKKFVQKNVLHRGVKVVSIQEIEFANSSRQFYQEFIENPLLIDGHAFDFGVYVLITSINPLRIYRYFSGKDKEIKR